MKAEIAVVTVSGKAYYLIVNEFKRRNIPFLSLTPYESIPMEVRVVLTTREEEALIQHQKVLVLDDGNESAAIVNEAVQIIQGRDSYEKVTIGIDPGEVFGLAVVADGKVIETENCYGLSETLHKIETLIQNLEDTLPSSISVKIGDGVRECKDKLLNALDETLPSNVVLESVREAGTDSCLNEAKHRRGIRDIVSAIQIAGRSGHRFQRRKQNESNC